MRNFEILTLRASLARCSIVHIMSKQSTLYKAWGGRNKETSSERARTSDNPSTSSSFPAANPDRNDCEIITAPDDDGAHFENYDDFFDDNDFADEDLLQGHATTDQLSRPSTSRDPTTDTASSTSTNLQQRTLAFHVGPSHSVLNSSIIEDDIPGFDPEAGELWIYPTNYPIRDYQFNIVQRALFTNTLVCLPTGLGKTFIAAVVMYNFYRWYPNSKIVFLAPTKPLVTQQIEACYNVMGIPQEHAAEMTGKSIPVCGCGRGEYVSVCVCATRMVHSEGVEKQGSSVCFLQPQITLEICTLC